MNISAKFHKDRTKIMDFPIIVQIMQSFTYKQIKNWKSESKISVEFLKEIMSMWCWFALSKSIMYANEELAFLMPVNNKWSLFHQNKIVTRLAIFWQLQQPNLSQMVEGNFRIILLNKYLLLMLQSFLV